MRGWVRPGACPPRGRCAARAVGTGSARSESTARLASRPAWTRTWTRSVPDPTQMGPTELWPPRSSSGASSGLAWASTQSLQAPPVWLRSSMVAVGDPSHSTTTIWPRLGRSTVAVNPGWASAPEARWRASGPVTGIETASTPAASGIGTGSAPATAVVPSPGSADPPTATAASAAAARRRSGRAVRRVVRRMPLVSARSAVIVRAAKDCQPLAAAFVSRWRNGPTAPPEDRPRRPSGPAPGSAPARCHRPAA